MSSSASPKTATDKAHPNFDVISISSVTKMSVSTGSDQSSKLPALNPESLNTAEKEKTSKTVDSVPTDPITFAEVWEEIRLKTKQMYDS